MAAPSVTWTFTNGTTSDATQVNTNFTDLINGASDGTKDYTIGTLSVAGATTLNGNVTLGDSTADDITITGSIAATIPFKANATYNIGSATLAPLSVYLGNGSDTVRLLAGTLTETYSLTLPAASPSVTGMTAIFDTNGTMSFRYADKFTASKTTAYTATGDETVIPCDASAAAFTVTLPAASTMTGKVLTIIKTDSDISKPVTIDANASEQIIPSVQSGQLTYILYTQYESVTIKCDGSNWYVVNAQNTTPWTNSGTNTVTATTSSPTKASGITVDKLWWRRVGKNVELRCEYAQSNTTSAAAGSGDYLWRIPSNMSIDTTSLTAFTTVIGGGASADTTNCVGNGIGRISVMVNISVIVYDATNVRYYVQSTGNGGMVSSTTGYAFTTANFSMNVEYRVPISGWNG